MKLFVILACYSDNCTYCDRIPHSIWTDEVKCLKALEELKAKFEERSNYFWWDITETDSDPEQLDERGVVV